PTGLTDVRQMWLQVVVKNAAGTVVYATGQPDSNGYLGEGTIVFNTVFGDGSGKKVSNIAKAREILSDHRVPPGKALKETITIPPGVRGQLHVEARLLYRSAPQKLVDSVMGKGKLTLPVTTMVAMKKRVNR
ncbi:MAG TPA: cytochrome c554 family protein, partial [Spirochaetota bacterium]|nr:cytochrome c554 family protein [Spirochaetota bacterium]